MSEYDAINSNLEDINSTPLASGFDNPEADDEESVEQKVLPSAFLNANEVVPDTILYKVPSARPKISAIRRASIMEENPGNQQTFEIEKHAPKKKFKLKSLSFGLMLGVYVPTVLNLICINFNVDVAKTIEKFGLGYGLILFSVYSLIAYGTLSSISALATNGEMQKGGCYYLVSRSLGSTYAGAIGIIMIIGHAASISGNYYNLGRIIVDLYPFDITKSRFGDSVLIQFISSCVVLGFQFLGVKFMVILMVFLLAALAIGIGFMFAGFATNKTSPSGFYEGFSAHRFKENWKPAGITFDLTMFYILSSMNGVITVADYSGSFPAKQAIPYGGYAALGTSTFFFLLMMFMISGCANFSNLPDSPAAFMNVSAKPLVSYIGFMCAGIGSAITMTLGGSRIITQMVKDGLLPKFINFKMINNESVGANIIIAILGFSFSFVQTREMIQSLQNIFFLIPIALVNLALYLTDSQHNPGFRPVYKFYNKWFSLFLVFVCLSRAVLVNWIIFLCVVAFLGLLVLFYHKCVKQHDSWGSILSNHVFYSTMKECLKLYNIPPHVKTYRSNIIFITKKKPNECMHAIDFINQLLSGHGMAAVGRVNITTERPNIRKLIKERAESFIAADDSYHVFYDITCAPTFHEGVRDFLLTAGIGMMRPNTLCLEFPEEWNTSECEEFFRTLGTAFDANFSVTVLRHLDRFMQVDRKGTVDVWWLADDGGLTLLLPYLLCREKQWKNAQLRIMTLCFIDEKQDFQKTQERMEHLLYKFRIKAEVITIEVSVANEQPSLLAKQKWINIVGQQPKDEQQDLLTNRYLLLSDLIRNYSASSSFIALTMLVPRETTNPKIYLGWLDLLSFLDVPFLFVRGNGENTLSWHI